MIGAYATHRPFLERHFRHFWGLDFHSKRNTDCWLFLPRFLLIPYNYGLTASALERKYTKMRPLAICVGNIDDIDK